MVAALLALGAAVAWGAADFLGGLQSRMHAVLVVLAVSQGAGLLVLAVVVAAAGPDLPAARFLVYGVLAGLAGAVGIGALYRGMAIGAISVVAPITATGAVIPVIFGIGIGERPSWVQGLGLLLALVGVVLASREPREEATRKASLATGVGLALVGAFSLGWFLVALDAASEGNVIWALFLQRGTLVAVVVASALIARPHMSLTFAGVGVLVVIGLLDTGANALFAVASTLGLVSLVAVIASLYPVTTVLLARSVLAERIGRGPGAGVATALVGVALITGG